MDFKNKVVGSGSVLTAQHYFLSEEVSEINIEVVVSSFKFELFDYKLTNSSYIHHYILSKTINSLIMTQNVTNVLQLA